jgi:hypothetical protein
MILVKYFRFGVRSSFSPWVTSNEAVWTFDYNLILSVVQTLYKYEGNFFGCPEKWKVVDGADTGSIIWGLLQDILLIYCWEIDNSHIKLDAYVPVIELHCSGPVIVGYFTKSIVVRYMKIHESIYENKSINLK